jgi:hypothetical protein
MADADADDEGNEALDMSWPDTAKKRITYLLVAPIIFPLWITLPDTRTPRGKPRISSCSVQACDRLCGLVVRVRGYRSGGPGSIPGTTRKKK